MAPTTKSLPLPYSSCPGKLKKASFLLKSSYCCGSSWSCGIKKAQELKKQASGKTSKKVRDSSATDTCSSPALWLLLIYFHWLGCPVRVQLSPHSVLGPSAPSLVSQLHSCIEHSQAAFPELSLTVLPLATEHLMNVTSNLNGLLQNHMKNCNDHQSKTKSRNLSLEIPQDGSKMPHAVTFPNNSVLTRS